MSWKKGPLPEGTYGWGGVVPEGTSNGFYFADFCGKFVRVIGTEEKLLKPEEVAFYDNSLTLPPHPAGSRL